MNYTQTLIIVIAIFTILFISGCTQEPTKKKTEPDTKKPPVVGGQKKPSGATDIKSAIKKIEDKQKSKLPEKREPPKPNPPQLPDLGRRG